MGRRGESAKPPPPVAVAPPAHHPRAACSPVRLPPRPPACPPSHACHTASLPPNALAGRRVVAAAPKQCSGGGRPEGGRERGWPAHPPPPLSSPALLLSLPNPAGPPPRACRWCRAVPPRSLMRARGGGSRRVGPVPGGRATAALLIGACNDRRRRRRRRRPLRPPPPAPACGKQCQSCSAKAAVMAPCTITPLLHGWTPLARHYPSTRVVEVDGALVIAHLKEVPRVGAQPAAAGRASTRGTPLQGDLHVVPRSVLVGTRTGRWSSTWEGCGGGRPHAQCPRTVPRATAALHEWPTASPRPTRQLVPRQSNG